MKKPIIGIDLDDTVFEFVKGFCVYHNRVYGSAFEQQHFQSWQMHEVLGCSEKEGRKRIVDFYHADDHQNIEPVDGAQNALRILGMDSDLLAITARDLSRSARMLDLVQWHFKNIFCDVHFLGFQKQKGEHCAELGIQFMVDDGLHNAQSVGERGIPVYLMNKPWNQCAEDSLPPKTIRVFSWDDVLRHQKLK